MRLQHKYDHYGNIEPTIMYLARPGKKLICALNGVDTSSASVLLRTNNTTELSFTIYKEVDGVPTNAYDQVDEMMELLCGGIWFKINTPPSIENDGTVETKEIKAESLEIMLTQYMLNNFLINQGEAGSYEMQYQETHDKTKFYQVKFYDPSEPKLSLLHLVLSHADVPGWQIGYVDNVTPGEQGTLLPDEICNFEVNEMNVYAFLTQEVSTSYKCIFEFDTVNMLINVYRVESLGKDTNITIGFRSIQDKVYITRDDSLVTQFYVMGLDDYNIDMANFGDNLITDLSHFVCDAYMSKELQDKYNAWVAYRESQRQEYMDSAKTYNNALEVLSELESRVPVDTVINDWFSASVEDLKSAYDDNSAIIKGIESLYVDDEGNFDLEALKDSPDWSLYESTMNYTLPSIVAALQSKGEEVEGFGKGNIISNVNPVSLGESWLTIGADIATITPYQLENSPAYGITRGIDVNISSSGNAGIYQKNIVTEITQQYVLSCYIKGSGTFQLEWGSPGEDRDIKSFEMTSGWTRVFYAFIAPQRLLDVAFTGDSSFKICGMQLEMGSTPSQFGYFTQSDKVLNAYETDWKLYGITELKNKLGVYENSIEELKKNGYADPYSPLSEYSEDYHTQMHQLYLDYLKLYDECKAALEERQAEYNAAQPEAVQQRMREIEDNVTMENFGKVQDEYEGFTDEEIYIIKSLYNQANYSNETMIITSLDSTVDAVDKQKMFYDDAVDRLYVESHPQYIYSDDASNIYALPEFKDFHEDLSTGNFIRLGLTDTKYVKLRVTEITYNPFDMDETMEITFSNVVKYRLHEDDYSSFFDDAIGSSRAGGRVETVNKSDTTDYVITADVIKQLFSNPLFNAMLGGTTVGGAGSGGTGSGGTITAETIIAELVKADEGVFEKLTADTAFIKYLDSQLVTSEKIVTDILEADQATIEKLSAAIINANQINVDVANILKLLAGEVVTEGVTTIHLTAENAVIDDAVIKELIASKISVADLATHTASAQLITLISSDGNPTIAFQDSTQQFYDSEGNVRVQIGQDGNGDFNFIIRGEDGKTALFDENGIHKEGIPDGTIINDMIEDATISQEKLGFQIIEPNDQGGVDITQIYDGKGNLWGVQYDSFKEETNNRLDELSEKAKSIELYADGQVFVNDNGTITPSIIKVYAIVKGEIQIAHWYIDDVEQTEYVADDKSYINIPSSYLSSNKQSIRIRATDETGVIYDVLSLYYIESGTDAVTVVINSSNGNIFKASEGIVSTVLSCIVYRGTEQVIPTWYRWLKQNGSTWDEVGTNPTLTVDVSDMENLENYRCQVNI